MGAGSHPCLPTGRCAGMDGHIDSIGTPVTTHMNITITGTNFSGKEVEKAENFGGEFMDALFGLTDESGK